MTLDRNYYIGKVLPGGYRIERFVGSGAFAYVYFARSSTRPSCAVKIQYNLVDDAKIRFGREIKVLKDLPPNEYLVQYYSDGITPEGYPYLVMEFVDGMTLKEALKQRVVWPVNECCQLILQLCDAFGGLHQLGIAHRDVKPDNIMLTRNRRVKLMDLGLIKDAQGLLKFLESEDIMNGRDFAENLDKGVLAGTPEYMAPEQFSDPSLDDELMAKTDTWTDVYSLGLIFYEMLTGTKLFVFTPNNASQAEYARSLLNYLKVRTSQNDAELVRPPNVPYQLWTIIARSLHADPTLRQRNAQEFSDDLRHYLTTGEGVADQDSDKTSAIDLSNFSEILKQNAQSAATVSLSAPSEMPSASPSYASVPTPSYASVPPPGSASMPNIPGVPVDYLYEDEGGDNNTWLWLIVIGLLLVVVVILVLVLYVL